MLYAATTLDTVRTFTFVEGRSSNRKAVIDGEGVLYTSTGFARVNVWDTRLAPCVVEVCTLDAAQIATFEYLPEELAGGGTGVPIDLALTADDSLLIGTFNHIYRALPKRWISVTEPVCPSDTATPPAPA